MIDDEEFEVVKSQLTPDLTSRGWRGSLKAKLLRSW